MADQSWRFGEEELVYIKEVLDSGFGAATTGGMNQRAGGQIVFYGLTPICPQLSR